MKLERIFAAHACPTKHLFLADKKIYKENALSLSKDLNRNFTKETLQMAKSIPKECPTSLLSIGKKHIKIAQRHVSPTTPPKMAKLTSVQERTNMRNSSSRSLRVGVEAGDCLQKLLLTSPQADCSDTLWPVNSTTACVSREHAYDSMSESRVRKYGSTVHSSPDRAQPRFCPVVERVTRAYDPAIEKSCL